VLRYVLCCVVQMWALCDVCSALSSVLCFVMCCTVLRTLVLAWASYGALKLYTPIKEVTQVRDGGLRSYLSNQQIGIRCLLGLGGVRVQKGSTVPYVLWDKPLSPLSQCLSEQWERGGHGQRARVYILHFTFYILHDTDIFMYTQKRPTLRPHAHQTL